VKSIRGTLLSFLLAGVALVGIVGAVFAYRNALAQAAAFFDYQLQQTALLVRDQPSRFVLPPSERATGTSYDFVVQVWSLQGVRMFLSRPFEVVPGIAPDGFSTVDAGGDKWRVYAVRTQDAIVQVAQPMRIRGSLARDAAFRSLTPFLLLIPLLAILIWWSVRRALAPVDELTAGLSKRAPLALEPLDEEHLPDEIRPLVRAMNGVLERLRAAVDRERAFLADAAHELRTPLAALALQVDALREVLQKDAREAQVAQLASGVRRATRMVEQLLALAREDAAASRERRPIALDTLAREVVTEMLPHADERQIDLGIAEAAPVTISGDDEALRTLARNLIDNAIRYTPRGGRVDVSVRAATAHGQAHALIEVSDSGPGIPPAERARVFERFRRLPGSDEPGSGLGLAIVRAIASSHGARVSLADGPHGQGLTVRVAFPALSS